MIAVENRGREITPLYGDLYSSIAADHISWNKEILRAIGHVSRWRVEEALRFIKQSYELEDLRARIYEIFRPCPRPGPPHPKPPSTQLWLLPV